MEAHPFGRIYRCARPIVAQRTYEPKWSIGRSTGTIEKITTNGKFCRVGRIANPSVISLLFISLSPPSPYPPFKTFALGISAFLKGIRGMTEMWR
jgi:hypothetical protein